MSLEKVVLSAMRVGFRAGGLVSPAAARRAAFRMFTSPPRSKPRTPEENAILERAEVRQVPFDGESLAVYSWKRPAGLADRGRVLLSHAWGSRASSLHAFVDPLLQRGFDVVGYDAPAHGASVKRQTTLRESGLAMLAVAEAVGPVHSIVGHSYGGLLAAYVAAGGKPLPRNIAVQRLVLISAPDRFDDLTRRFAEVLKLPDRIRQGVDDRVSQVLEQPIAEVRSARWLADSELSALVIHDRQDREIPFENGVALAAASPTVRLVATEELGHRRILRDPEVLETAADFVADGRLTAGPAS